MNEETGKSQLGQHHRNIVLTIGMIPHGKLRSEGKCLKETRYLHIVPYPAKIFVNYKGKNSNRTVETPGRHHVIQITQFNITGDNLHQCHVLRKPQHSSCGILAQNAQFLSQEKTDKLKLKDIYKVTGQCSLKVSRS